MRPVLLPFVASLAIVAGVWPAPGEPSERRAGATRRRRSPRRARRLVWLPAVAVVLGVAASLPQPARTSPALPHVTVIADSVLTAVLWNPAPLAVLGEGLDLRMEVGVCRKLTGVSCPFEGGAVPTLVDVVAQLGPALGPTVVVEVGYSDDPATFSDSVEQAVDRLVAVGVQQLLWVNLRETQPQYAGMNATLVAAAKRHPEMTVLDWNAYSHEHYSWFQGDGIHLVYEGAMAIATFLHAAVVEALAPPLAVTTERLPVAQVGVPYSARMVAGGGSEPYTWRLVSGPLPRGLRLLADGSVGGTPRRSGRFALTFRVTDSCQRTATRSETLTIRKRSSTAGSRDAAAVAGDRLSSSARHGL